MNYQQPSTTLDYARVAQSGGVNSAPIPLRPIQEAYARQDHELGALGEALNELERQLEGVLLPAPPATAGRGDSATPASPMSPHYYHASTVAVTIAGLRARVVDLLERLQA